MNLRSLVLGGVVAASLAQSCLAWEPGWSGNIIASPQERAAIEATPILERPYRPLHFYGNTVRRRHYRGSALPGVRDVRNGTGALARAR